MSLSGNPLVQGPPRNADLRRVAMAKGVIAKRQRLSRVSQLQMRYTSFSRLRQLVVVGNILLKISPRGKGREQKKI